MFFWKPLCDGYYDSNVWHKSKQFQYLTFSLGSIEPKKGNNMNEIMEPADFSPLVDLVEILDADGNPTGQYRPSETPQEGSTKYTTAEDGEHEVVLN